MKASAITARDTRPGLLDIRKPEPDTGEVLVAVEAASVNGFDLSVAAGYVWDMIPHEFPVVPGRDRVGTVTAVGRGVDSIGVGDRVAAVIPGLVQRWTVSALRRRHPGHGADHPVSAPAQSTRRSRDG